MGTSAQFFLFVRIHGERVLVWSTWTRFDGEEWIKGVALFVHLYFKAYPNSNLNDGLKLLSERYDTVSEIDTCPNHTYDMELVCPEHESLDEHFHDIACVTKDTFFTTGTHVVKSEGEDTPSEPFLYVKSGGKTFSFLGSMKCANVSLLSDNMPFRTLPAPEWDPTEAIAQFGTRLEETPGTAMAWCLIIAAAFSNIESYVGDVVGLTDDQDDDIADAIDSSSLAIAVKAMANARVIADKMSTSSSLDEYAEKTDSWRGLIHQLNLTDAAREASTQAAAEGKCGQEMYNAGAEACINGLHEQWSHAIELTEHMADIEPLSAQTLDDLKGNPWIQQYMERLV